MSEHESMLTPEQQDFISQAKATAPAKQQKALSLGATEQEVASASRVSVDEVRANVADNNIQHRFDGDVDTEISHTRLAPIISARDAAAKAVYATLANGGDLTEDYVNVYDELTQYGSSSTLNRIERDVSAREIDQLDSTIRSSARLGDVSTTQTLLDGADSILKERTNIKVAALENAADSYSERYNSTSIDQKQEEYLQSLSSRVDIKEKVNAIITQEVANSSSDFANFFAEQVESSIFGEQLLGLASVGTDILGKRYNFAGGTMLRDLAQHLRSLPVEDQEQEAKRIVESITKHAGVVGKSDAVKVFTLETFREFVNSPGGDVPMERWLTDVIGYSDIAFFVPTTVLVRLGKRLVSLRKSASAVSKIRSLTPNLADVNPDVEAALVAASVRNSEVAEKLGTSSTDAMDKMMPSRVFDDDTILEGAPTSTRERILGSKTKADEAVETIQNTFIYGTEEYAAKMMRIQQSLEDASRAAEVKPTYSMLDIDANTNAVTMRAVYGDTTDMPLTLEKAQAMRENIANILESEGVEKNSVKIVVKDDVTSTFETYNPDIHSSDGKFLIAYNTKAEMGYMDILPTTAEASTKGIGSTITGSKVATYFVDPQSYVQRLLINGARVANDAKFLKAHQLNKLAKPFTSLNWFGQKRVAAVLKSGEEFVDDATGEVVGKTYKYHELAGHLSEPEIEAYYAARVVNDTIYSIKNTTMRDKLVSQGFKGLDVDLGNGKFYRNGIREVDDAEIIRGTNVAVDPSTGEELSITADKLVELREKGLTIGKLLRPFDKGNKAFSYAVIKHDSVTELPANVFPRREGYNFRINNDPYFIDRKSTRTLDGVKGSYTPTVAVARSAEEAKRMVAKLQAENEGELFTARLDRNINSEDTALKNDIDMLDGGGLDFWFSQRGKRLLRIDGTESSIEDPVSAMHRMIAATANVATHQDFMQASIKRHKATYGDIEVGGKPLWYWDDRRNDFVFDKTVAKESGDPRISAALAEYNYLEQLQYAPTATDIWWKDTLARIDYAFGQHRSITGKGLTSKAVGGVTRALATTTPGQFVRGAAFAMTIPLRPFRHLPLQAMHAISLAGIDPKIMVQSFRDAGLLTISMATYQNPEAWKWTLKASKALGYNPEDWADTFNSFRQTGKAYSIDSHVAVGEANFSWSRSMPETGLGLAAKWGTNLIKSPVTIGKTLGFDTGELINQATTYMFALKRWQKANPGVPFKNNKRVLDQIAADARNLSVDMTKTSAFGYQKGMFASMTQFMAINHKMLLKIIGADPSLPTKKAKAAYITGLLAMYGTAGIGAQNFYDSWSKSLDVEIPPLVDDVIYGGFTQFMFNLSLDLAFGNAPGTTRTDFAGSFAPTSGTLSFIPEFIENAYNFNVVELLEGPSRNLFPNVARAVSFVGDVWGRDDLDTGEKVIDSFQVATREFGSFSDYYKLNLIKAYNDKMEQLYMVDKDGRPTVIAHTWGEIYAKAILSVGSRGEKELYEDYLGMYRETASSGKKHIADVDKEAKHFVKWLYQLRAENPDDFEFRRKAKSVSFALHKGALPGRDGVYEKAMKLFTQDPRHDEFVANIARNTAVLNPDMDEEAMANFIRHSDAMPEEDKERLVKHIKQLRLSAEKTREFIKENQ